MFIPPKLVTVLGEKVTDKIKNILISCLRLISALSPVNGNGPSMCVDFPAKRRARCQRSSALYPGHPWQETHPQTSVVRLNDSPV